MLSVLEDLIPTKYRKWVVYVLIPLFVVIYGVWKANDGNWSAFWPALVPAIIGWLVAAPNTHPGVEVSDEIEDDDFTDDEVDLEQQPDPEAPAPVVSGAEALAAAENAEGQWDVNEGEDYR